LLSILSLVAAALLPLAANSQGFPFHRHHQHNTVETAAPAETGEASPYKYDAYLGFGYTSLNMVNGSRYGLMGAELAVTRYWGKHLGLVADGAVYEHPVSTPVVVGYTQSPTVDVVLFGPVFEAKFIGNTSIFARGLLGGEHVGGFNQSPNISFAGGAGVGMDYKLSNRLLLRAAGDDIASSFTLIGTPAVPNPGANGLSPNRTRSSRATFGVVYKF
jgi:hypothetical protein